jgi:urate oxidase
MAHQLGHTQYGKAETRVVRIYRDDEPHQIVDYNVGAALSGDFADTHLTGDNAKVLTTDAVKNTVNAYAMEHGEAARDPESFGLALARHFVDDVPSVARARVTIEAYPWLRLASGGAPNPHAFVRDGQYVRTATVAYENGRAHVVSGLRDLVVLKSTDSEFHGFYEERYTTLQPTTDRVMATSVSAQWWHTTEDVGWAQDFHRARDVMCEAFAASYSYALQQTLFEMGSAVLDAVPSAGEIRLSLPNKHHFAVDLSPFGLENRNEVLYAADRPYGLIEGTVRRDGAPEPGIAFDPGQGW